MDKFPMDEMTGAAETCSHAIRPKRLPQCCRWGQSTLFLPYPEWLSAWDSPWSCRHPAHKGPLETVDICTTCPDCIPIEGSASSTDGGSSRKMTHA